MGTLQGTWITGQRWWGRGESKESEGQRRRSGERAQTLLSEVPGSRTQEAGVCAVGREEAQGGARGIRRSGGQGLGSELLAGLGRRGGKRGADSKGMVSGRGTGVLRRPTEGTGVKDWDQQSGARAGEGAQRLGSQGPTCPHWVRGAKPHLWLPGEMEGAMLRVPAKTYPPPPLSPGPT